MPIPNYRIPGVYPRKEVDEGIISISPLLRTPVIIGRGQHAVEATVYIGDHTLDGTDEISSPFGMTFTEGVVSIIRVGDHPEQYKYYPIDYAEATKQGYTFTGTWDTPSLNVNDKGEVSWAGAALQPASGDGYYITYEYKAEPDQYDFHLYQNENDLKQRHGTESATNLLSVGGAVALRNGAPVIGCIQLNLPYQATVLYPAVDVIDKDLSGLSAGELIAVTDAAFVAALDVAAELDVDQCRYLVPMTTKDTTLLLYLDHVDEYSLTDMRRWRMLCRGIASQPTYSNTYVRDQLITLARIYQGNSSARRMILVSPGEINRVIYDSVTKTISNVAFDGSVLAAAAAGRICSFANPASSITNRQLQGFTLGRAFSKSDMLRLGADGVCAIIIKRSQIRCMHGLTCDLTDATTQEISVVEIEDYIKVHSINILEDRFIGMPITGSLFMSLAGVLSSFWEDLVARGVIAEYDRESISPRVSSADPRAIEVSGRVRPAFPLTWLDIAFTFTSGLALRQT